MSEKPFNLAGLFVDEGRTFVEVEVLGRAKAEGMVRVKAHESKVKVPDEVLESDLVRSNLYVNRWA